MSQIYAAVGERRLAIEQVEKGEVIAKESGNSLQEAIAVFAQAKLIDDDEKARAYAIRARETLLTDKPTGPSTLYDQTLADVSAWLEQVP